MSSILSDITQEEGLAIDLFVEEIYQGRLNVLDHEHNTTVFKACLKTADMVSAELNLRRKIYSSNTIKLIPIKKID